MNIVVVGCGKIGTSLIANLVKEGHDVVAIDNDPEAIADIRDIYDVICLCGNGTDYDILTEAEIDKAVMFIAVTGSDELNMLSCIIAKKMGAQHTVARVRNPEYNEKNLGFIKQQIDLSLSLNPELLTAHELFNILRLPSAVNIETFSRNFEMIELVVKQDSAINGMALIDMRKKYSCNFLVCVVQRGEKIYIPDGNFVLQSGDRIGLTAAPSQVQKLIGKLGLAKKQAKNVMILGASKTAFYLSKMLLDAGTDVKLIDLDKKRCEEVSAKLTGATVINGDGAEQELLLEEGITSCDAFVTLTGMDEENILISYYAMTNGVPKVITKVNRTELCYMADKLGLDTVISPKKTVCDVVSRYARALENSLESNIETLYKLMDGRVEAVEFLISPDFKYINIPIRELKFKENILIAGILRKRKAIIPTGDDFFAAGDSVVVIAADRQINNISDIMR